MKITYDLEYLPERKLSHKVSEEVTALKAFLATKRRNMCFEYDDEKAAKSKYGTLGRFKRANNLQQIVDVYRVDKCIYIVKTKKPAAKREEN